MSEPLVLFCRYGWEEWEKPRLMSLHGINNFQVLTGQRRSPIAQFTCSDSRILMFEAGSMVLGLPSRGRGAERVRGWDRRFAASIFHEGAA